MKTRTITTPDGIFALKNDIPLIKQQLQKQNQLIQSKDNGLYFGD
jgi:hypothetical protein